MIESLENNFGNVSYVYEIEQIVWENGKGQKNTILVEAISMIEAIKLSGSDDGMHQIASIKELGSVFIRSKAVLDQLTNKCLIEEFDKIIITKEEKFRASNLIHQSCDMVRIIADMPLNTLKQLKKYITTKLP